MNITFLGTGTSTGVPSIGCGCEVCRSDNPKDKRLRSSICIETDTGENIIIDTGPDFREQCLREDITSLEAVLYTHAHMDHLAGLDDLRRFNGLRQGSLSVYGKEDVLKTIMKTFPYAFPDTYTTPLIPTLVPETIDYFKPFSLAGTEITPFPLNHGEILNTGYFFNGAAYCTDCSGIPEESAELINGCRVLILGALRQKPHPKHFSFEQACETAAALGAGKTYLTHIGHDILHSDRNTVLKGQVEFAYDGLNVEL